MNNCLPNPIRKLVFAATPITVTRWFFLVMHPVFHEAAGSSCDPGDIFGIVAR